MSLPADELLSAFHDGELNSAERAAVEQRLTTSADARRELSKIRQVSALLKELPRERLPSEFPQQMLQAIERETLIPTQHVDEPDSTMSRSSRRWIGLVALLTSAAGLLLLLRAFDDPGLQDKRHLAESLIVPSAPGGVAADSSEAERVVSVPMLADAPATATRTSDIAAGAAGQNSFFANSPATTFNRTRLAGIAGAENLFFEQSTLSTAEIGTVVRAIERIEGDEVAVVLLTVVDRQQGLEGFQLLLKKNHIRQTEAESSSKADRLSAHATSGDQMHAVLVQSDIVQLSETLQQLRQEKYWRSLEVDQPILLAQLDEVRSGRVPQADKAKDEVAPRENSKLAESQSATRRMKVAQPETAGKKLSAPAAGPLAKSNAARDAKEPLANQSTFELPLQVLVQNQSVQQTRNRGLAKGQLRSQTAGEKNADSAKHRPLQVLFVVVDQSQTGQPIPPSNSSSKPAAPAKARTEPAKPSGQDGAS